MSKYLNNLTKMVCTLVAVIGLTTSANAFSLNGLYLELGSSAVGVEMDGNHNDNDGDVSNGTVGKTAVTGSYGLGYMTSRDRPLSFDLGYMVTPGDAKISATSDDSNTDVTMEVSDSTEWYITAMANITEDASLYFKYGQNDADITTTGDIDNPGDLSGDTVALGTVMSWGSSFYIRTEAGKTTYDTISASGKGSAGGISSSVKVTADPSVNYGKIALGYKF